MTSCRPIPVLAGGLVVLETQPSRPVHLQRRHFARRSGCRRSSGSRRRSERRDTPDGTLQSCQASTADLSALSLQEQDRLTYRRGHRDHRRHRTSSGDDDLSDLRRGSDADVNARRAATVRSAGSSQPPHLLTPPPPRQTDTADQSDQAEPPPERVQRPRRRRASPTSAPAATARSQRGE